MNQVLIRILKRLSSHQKQCKYWAFSSCIVATNLYIMSTIVKTCDYLRFYPYDWPNDRHFNKFKKLFKDLQFMILKVKLKLSNKVNQLNIQTKSYEKYSIYRIYRIIPLIINTINTKGIQTWNKYMILTRIPWNLDRALKGLNARRVRIVLKAWIFPTPAQVANKLMTDTYVLFGNKFWN